MEMNEKQIERQDANEYVFGSKEMKEHIDSMFKPVSEWNIWGEQ